MLFKVTEIQFDFTGDDSEVDDIDTETQDEIYDDVMGTVWEADDEDDLLEEITAATGWCIKSIDYVHVLSWAYLSNPFATLTMYEVWSTISDEYGTRVVPTGQGSVYYDKAESILKEYKKKYPKEHFYIERVQPEDWDCAY